MLPFGRVIGSRSSCLELQLGEGWEFRLILARSLTSGKSLRLEQEGLTKKLLSYSSKMADSSLAKFSILIYLL